MSTTFHSQCLVTRDIYADIEVEVDNSNVSISHKPNVIRFCHKSNFCSNATLLMAIPQLSTVQF